MALFGLIGRRSTGSLKKKYLEVISDGLRHRSSLAGRRMAERRWAKRK